MPQVASAKDKGAKRIKVGQIGTAHGHASGKLSTLRKVEQDYEVVGVVEADDSLRKRAEKSAAYRGLTWMSEAELLRRRVRYFADGLVIGTAAFVNHAFRLTRDRFGPKRTDGARKMRGMATALCSMRDLRGEGITRR